MKGIYTQFNRFEKKKKSFKAGLREENDPDMTYEQYSKKVDDDMWSVLEKAASEDIRVKGLLDGKKKLTDYVDDIRANINDYPRSLLYSDDELEDSKRWLEDEMLDLTEDCKGYISLTVKERRKRALSKISPKALIAAAVTGAASYPIRRIPGVLKIVSAVGAGAGLAYVNIRKERSNAESKLASLAERANQLQKEIDRLRTTKV
ncbi:hypothetical protein COV93_02020 [Candidatus Woesearchaeota archaeon CG11_big_fil_rev_8_21_14_0_20_43_8]|nr:MAG: hypothetical protein COV93_02020 [Candidatus Woesearchaeota archaeon CG11_big_fil_rev_8_21_14_0_20_43_8]PIO07053.1 MAG: hypothetical protein COT47_01710 [Candidatus Woesearchaeota archaeon CG08_land_8_20_14_0_20_43_7]